MMPRPPILALASLLASAAFAGCIADGDPSAVAPSGVELNPTLTGEALQREVEGTLKVTKESKVLAPAWTVGEYWKFDVFFSFEPEPLTFTAVVYDETPSDYLVATDSRDAALFEALFDIPFLGPFEKGTLDTTNEGDPMTFYEWPLENDKSWTGKFDRDFDGTAEPYTFHTAFEMIETPEGTLPGFTIHGMNDDDVVLFQYDYVPAFHWANHIFWFNEEDPEEFDVHLMVTDHGFDWKGELRVMEAEVLLSKDRTLAVNPDAPGESVVPTDPPAFTFEVAKDYTTIAGFAYAFNFAGAHETLLVSPAGKTYEWRSTMDPANPMAFDFQFGFLDVPSERGTWKLVLAGAGVAAGGGVLVDGVLETKVSR